MPPSTADETSSAPRIAPRSPALDLLSQQQSKLLVVISRRRSASPTLARYWPERDPADFDPVGTTGRRIVDRATGEQYTVVGHDPFQAQSPEEGSIEFFLIREGDSQIGHAYLHLDDGSTGDEGRDLGFITLTAATEIAQDHDAEVDIDGPTREEWDAAV